MYTVIQIYEKSFRGLIEYQLRLMHHGKCIVRIIIIARTHSSTCEGSRTVRMTEVTVHCLTMLKVAESDQQVKVMRGDLCKD